MAPSTCLVPENELAKGTMGHGTIMASPPGRSLRDPARGQKVAVRARLSCVLIRLAMLRAGALVRGHLSSPDTARPVSAVPTCSASAGMAGAGMTPAWGSLHPEAAKSPSFFSPNTGID